MVSAMILYNYTRYRDFNTLAKQYFNDVDATIFLVYDSSQLLSNEHGKCIDDEDRLIARVPHNIRKGCNLVDFNYICGNYYYYAFHTICNYGLYCIAHEVEHLKRFREKKWSAMNYHKYKKAVIDEERAAIRAEHEFVVTNNIAYISECRIPTRKYKDSTGAKYSWTLKQWEHTL